MIEPSMTTPRHPNLLIVGAARCGTTALWHHLGAHPQVLMSRKKEPSYFGSDLRIWRSVRPTLQKHLENSSGKEEALCLGEASTFYLLSTRAVAEIKAFNPEAKILITLRNPVDFLCSQHHIALFMGQQDMRAFAAALEAVPRRRRGEAIPPQVCVYDFLDYHRAGSRLSAPAAAVRSLEPHRSETDGSATAQPTRRRVRARGSAPGRAAGAGPLALEPAGLMSVHR